eukprot:Gb_37112 [translate_table: standard]
METLATQLSYRRPNVKDVVECSPVVEVSCRDICRPTLDDVESEDDKEEDGDDEDEDNDNNKEEYGKGDGEEDASSDDGAEENQGAGDDDKDAEIRLKKHCRWWAL